MTTNEAKARPIRSLIPARLTVSETWPIEIRAEAIAVFFAIGCIAGALGPVFYGALIGNGSSRTGLFIGYLIGAGIMLIGGLVEAFLGVQAAGKSLEQVTKPLTSTDQAATQAASTVPHRTPLTRESPAEWPPATPNHSWADAPFHTFRLMKRTLARGGMVS